MKMILKLSFTMFTMFMFTGCNTNIHYENSDFDCSKLSLEEKQLMNDTIEKQLNSLESSFKNISDSSYDPGTRANSINKIVLSVHTNVKKEYCIELKK